MMQDNPMMSGLHFQQNGWQMVVHWKTNDQVQVGIYLYPNYPKECRLWGNNVPPNTMTLLTREIQKDTKKNTIAAAMAIINVTAQEMGISEAVPPDVANMLISEVYRTISGERNPEMDRIKNELGNTMRSAFEKAFEDVKKYKDTGEIPDDMVKNDIDTEQAETPSQNEEPTPQTGHSMEDLLKELDLNNEEGNEGKST